MSNALTSASSSRIPADYSVEVTLRDPEAFDAAVRLLPPSSEVFIADLPNQEPDLLVEAAIRYHRSDFRPVPHLVARNIGSEGQLQDLLARLVRDAGVERVFLLGGDREEPAGPYSEALDLLATGLIQRQGIGKIALACFPEGHPRISREALDRALEAKLQMAMRDRLQVLLVSQFVFEAQPLLDYAACLRARGVAAPLRIGIAGPADTKTLLKFGRELGAGASIRALEQTRTFGAEPEQRTPRELLSTLATAWTPGSGLLFERLHFFAFGSTESTITWAEARRRDPSTAP